MDPVGPPDTIITVAVVDDEEILLDTLVYWLGRATTQIDVAAVARSVDTLLADLPDRVQVILLDLLLRDGTAPTDNVRRLISHSLTVVAFSGRDNPILIRDVIAAGAHSYVHKAKNPAEVCQAIRSAAAGIPYTSRVAAAAMEAAAGPGGVTLSHQEREVLRLYTSGMTIVQVARRLHLTPGTVKSYIDRARRKYEEAGRPAHTKIDLRQRAGEDGLLPHDA